MRTRTIVPGIAAALTLSLAGSAAGATSSTAVRAAQAATQAARTITFHLRDGGNGSLTLTRIGRTRTRIVLHVPPGSSTSTARIFRGRDCNDQRHLADSLIALRPINASGAQVSQTIVSVPLERFTSDYVVDLRKASERQQIAEACAHLGG